MLLTSSQVSIAASSGIIILCTTALFLSGYVLQQRTLRDLRQAIRAPAQPKPQMFLPDRFKYSTTELEDGSIVTLEIEPVYRPPQAILEESEREVVVEVRPTVGGAGERTDDATEGPAPSPRAGDDEMEEVVVVTEEKEVTEKQVKGAKGKKTPKKESAAQRRRRIKEELRQLAHDNKPVYYQRRLW